MAIKLKANIGYQPIVTEVSRKFVPKKQTCTNIGTAGPVEIAVTGWMGGAVRNTGRGGLGACQRNYLVIRQNARTNPLTDNELAARAYFVKAVTGRNYIINDLSQIARIQEMFVESSQDHTKTCNGVSAYGYTYNGWIMAVQYAGVKINTEAGRTYNEKVFPADFDA